MPLVDENKEKLIENQLLWDNRVAAHEITVKVTDSTAILTGTVGFFHEMMAAEEDALGVPGIMFVENKISVTYPEETVVLTDPEIKRSLKNMLEWDTRIDSTTINVNVDAGILTLIGNVDAFWKRKAVENLAYSLSGVIDVVNNLNVGWADQYTDERIAEDIKNALLRSNLINVADVKIEVRNGKVTLKGKAPNLVAKRIATDKAAYTTGVTAINNQMEIV